MSHKEDFANLRKLLHEEEIDKFEKTLVETSKDKTPETVEALIRFLKDDDDYLDEMYQILHVAEGFPREVYLTGFLRAFDEQMADHYWLGVLLLRVMNDPIYFSRLCEIAKSVNEDVRGNLMKVTRSTSEERAEFSERAQTLLAVLT